MYASTFIGAALIQSALGQLIDETAVAKYNFPPSRGSSSLVASVGPCQGFEVGGRADYPVNGGVISWSALRDISNIKISYSTSEDPTSQDNFREALTNVTGGWVGQQCIDGPNFGALGLSAGDEITLQFLWQAGPNLVEAYECADLRLVSESAFEDLNIDTSCTNYIETTQLRRDSVANPELVTLREEAEAELLADQDNGNSNSGLSVTEAGVVGAMVTLGVFIIVLGVGWATGAIALGRRSQEAQHRPKTGSISTSSV